MNDPFVTQIAELCREHVTRAKWVFVPTHALGRVLGERLALAGTNWVNLRFVTPLDIALRMGAPFLVERGIDPSEDGLGPALVMRLLLDLPEQDGYFRPLGDQPSMAQALWSTIRELRLCGVTSGDLRAEAFESPAKHAELRALVASYERFLETSRRGDMAVVYEEAMQHPDWCPIQSEDCWTELPDVVWAPLQRRLMDAMPGERILPQTLQLPGTTRPRRVPTSGTRPHVNGGVSAVAGAAAGPLGGTEVGPLHSGNATADRTVPPRRSEGATTGTNIPPRQLPLLATADTKIPPLHAPLQTIPARHALAFLMAPDSVPAGVPADLELFHAGGRDAEIEEVFRRILRAGAPLDEVEIACASAEYAPIVWEKALRQPWPVTIGPGLPATLTRPGRALLAFCEWIESHFHASLLRQLLQSGDLRMDTDDLTPGQAARLLSRAEAAWGRATYDLALGRLATSYRSAATNADLPEDVRTSAATKADRTDRLQAWVRELLAAVPAESADGFVALQDSVTAALTFLSGCAAKASALDAAAASTLDGQIAELRALGPFRCRLDTALRFIRERIEGSSVAGDRPRPGHLHLSTLAQSGYSGRPRLFVVGLEEGRVFPAAVEDPVLLDAERSSMHPALRLSTDRVDEAVWSALLRLGAHAGPSVLSYSSRDTREYRATYASWLMLQAFRVTHGDSSKSYRDLHKALGEAKSYVPDAPGDAATDAGWWLSALRPAGCAIEPEILRQFPALAQGRHADEQRRSASFTPFDGHVPEAGQVLDPCRSPYGVSPTALEDAAACGFRYFLKRGLRLDPVDAGERDGDVWLDPLTRGRELHDLYAAALRRCRDRNRRPDRPVDEPWLLATARARLETLRVEMPPPSDEVFDRESRELLADLELFLDEECDAPEDRTPVGFEVSFGRTHGGGEEQPEPFAQADPIELALGGGLRFRLAGRIDRIDRIGASTFEVIDYKTGGYWADTWARGVFRGGRRLQHALYGLAAVELLKRQYKKPVVSAGVYYFPTAKGGQERRRIPTPSRAQIAGVLEDLRRTIASGVFLHTADQDDCRFCDFGRACGAPGALDRVKNKMGDSALAVRARLDAHE